LTFHVRFLFCLNLLRKNFRPSIAKISALTQLYPQLELTLSKHKGYTENIDMTNSITQKTRRYFWSREICSFLGDASRGTL